MRYSLATTLTALLTPLTSGHFLLNYPPSIGFSDDSESTAPCGGFLPNFNNVTTPTANLTVDAFPVDVSTTHPQSQWLFRAALGGDAPFNWTNLKNVVNETGVGGFCIPDLSLPESVKGEWVGKLGVLQIVQLGMGTTVYQCAAVSFIGGADTVQSPSCMNATGLTAFETNMTDIATTVEGSTPTTTGSMSMTMTTTGTGSAMTMTGSGKGSTKGSMTGSVTGMPSATGKSEGVRVVRATGSVLLGILVLVAAASL